MTHPENVEYGQVLEENADSIKGLAHPVLLSARKSVQCNWAVSCNCCRVLSDWQSGDSFSPMNL